MKLSPSFPRVLLRLSILVSLTLLCSCATSLKEVPVENVVMVDEYSRLLDPTGNTACVEPTGPRGLCRGNHDGGTNYRPLAEPYRTNYIDTLLKSVSERPEGKRRLLIFVHGGLNTQKTSVKRAVKLAPEVDQAGYYPLFINWRSSLVNSYFDHLFFVRQGEEMKYLGPLTSPFTFVYDIGRAVLRAPLVWSSQIYGGVQALPGAPLPNDLKGRQDFLLDDQKAHPGKAISILPGEDMRSEGEKQMAAISWVVWQPIRFLVAAPLTDGFGTSAWDTMQRRTQLLFHTMEEYEKNHPPEPKGDLYVVMKKLEDVLRSQGQWDVVLVGHSMGTIVLNEMLRQFPDFPASTIIYMAAACSVRDFEQSVIPYLRRHNQTTFYNLTLQRRAEEGERWEPFHIPYVDWAMRGSLLVWIDEFFSNPLTPENKTLGRYVNFLRNEQLLFPSELRGRIYQKEFRYGDSVSKTDPQKHGDFDRCPFWKKEFYSLEHASQDPKLFCSED